MVDFFLEVFELALGGEEVAGDFVFKEGVASAFKLADLGGTELDAGVLLVVEFFTTFVDALVLEAGRVVIEEAFDIGLECDEGCVCGDGGAEFFGFDDEGGFFSGDGHGVVLSFG